jgi:hypothetical protein
LYQLGKELSLSEPAQAARRGQQHLPPVKPRVGAVLPGFFVNTHRFVCQLDPSLPLFSQRLSGFLGITSKKRLNLPRKLSKVLQILSAELIFPCQTGCNLKSAAGLILA